MRLLFLHRPVAENFILQPFSAARSGPAHALKQCQIPKLFQGGKFNEQRSQGFFKTTIQKGNQPLYIMSAPGVATARELSWRKQEFRLLAMHGRSFV
ncbi:MAG: hypothetical protein HY074_03440 [Deltaproteobacteria bacterium]|nr:hypothetical protein [Deltaproteobacteria bacterium]